MPARRALLLLIGSLLLLASAARAQPPAGPAPFSEGLALFEAAMERRGPERDRLLEEAATELIRRVNEAPEHPEAPTALLRAGQAFELVGRLESAERIYQRVVESAGPLRGADRGAQERLDEQVSEALFRLGALLERAGRPQEALARYRRLALSSRMARSSSLLVQDRVREARLRVDRIQSAGP